jgi:hypothetical protein
MSTAILRRRNAARCTGIPPPTPYRDPADLDELNSDAARLAEVTVHGITLSRPK